MKKPLLIAFPGSFSKLAKALKDFLLETMSGFFEVRMLESGEGTDYPHVGKLWNYTQNPGKHLDVSRLDKDGIPNPIEFIKQCLDEFDNDGRDYFILGTSYSGRVVGCLLEGGEKYYSQIGQAPKGIILTGYPLYKKPSDDKAALLAQETFPAGTRMLYIGGTRDKEYLAEGPTSGAAATLPMAGLSGEALLRAFVSTLKCASTTTIVMTPGNHDILNTLVADRVPARCITANALLDFAESFGGGSLGARVGFPFGDDEEAKEGDTEPDGEGTRKRKRAAKSA